MMLDTGRWYPVAATDDVPIGHVYQTSLGGFPLAVWRAADGTVNTWEDRCPHRGVRFTVGNAIGNELRCQYHAWRFASGSGACVRIPAHPEIKPPANIRATVWPVLEAGGFIWTGSAPIGRPEVVLDTPLARAIPINRSGEFVEASLKAENALGATLLVQPVTETRCVIRGWSSGDIWDLDIRLEQFRRRMETDIV